MPSPAESCGESMKLQVPTKVTGCCCGAGMHDALPVSALRLLDGKTAFPRDLVEPLNRWLESLRMTSLTTT
jgi:hypothetical protein